MKESDIEKEVYTSPVCEVVVVETEGLVCASKDEYVPIPF